MVKTIAQELHQTRPFQSVQQEALLDLKLTSAVLFQPWVEHLRRHTGISNSQYNVLRILRGAGEQGARISEVADRMVGRDPDVTRLADGLEKQGLLTRQRSTEDRRVVVVSITGAGLALLAELDERVSRFVASSMAGLPDNKLRELITLLDDLRNGMQPFTE